MATSKNYKYYDRFIDYINKCKSSECYIDLDTEDDLIILKATLGITQKTFKQKSDLVRCILNLIDTVNKDKTYNFTLINVQKDYAKYNGNRQKLIGIRFTLKPKYEFKKEFNYCSYIVEFNLVAYSKIFKRKIIFKENRQVIINCNSNELDEYVNKEIEKAISSIYLRGGVVPQLFGKYDIIVKAQLS